MSSASSSPPSSEDEAAAEHDQQHDHRLRPSLDEKNTNEHQNENEYEEDAHSGRRNPSPQPNPSLEEYEIAIGSSLVSVSEIRSSGENEQTAPNESSPLLGGGEGSQNESQQSRQSPNSNSNLRPSQHRRPARQPYYYDSYLGDATPIINNLSAFLQPGYSWHDDDVAFSQDCGDYDYDSTNNQEGGGLMRSIFGGMTGRRSSFNKQQQQGHHRRRRESRRRDDGVTDTLDRLEELGVVTHSPTKQRGEERGQEQPQSSSSAHHDPSSFPSMIRRLSSSRHQSNHHHTHWKKNYFLTFVLVFSCVGSMFVLTVSGPDHTNSTITFGGGGRNVVVASSPTTDEEGGTVKDRGDNNGRESLTNGRRRHGNHGAGGRSSYYRQYRRYYTQGGGAGGGGGADWLMSEEPTGAQQREVVPTLLGFVYPDTYDSVDAIDNGLYDEMAEAEYIGSIGDIRPNAAIANKRRGQSRSRLPTLTVDRTAVTFHHSLTLSWEDGTDVRVRDDDVIALYCPAAQDDPRSFRDAATVEQIVATGGYEWDGEEVDDDDDDDDFYRHYHPRSKNDRAKIYKRDEKEEKSGKGSWTIRHFPIVRESSCEFRLWSRQAPNKKPTGSTARREESTRNHQHLKNDDEESAAVFKLVARTGLISLPRAMDEPTAIHLALSSDPSEMVLSFTTGVAGTPVVQYGPLVDEALAYDDEDYLPFTFEAMGTSTTYDAGDMCELPATSTNPGLFVSPGQLHSVVLNRLVPNVNYSYRVGVRTPGGRFHDVYKSLANFMYEDGVVWSHVHTFHTAPQVPVVDLDLEIPSEATADAKTQTPIEPFTFLVYADQGSPAIGWDAARVSLDRLIERELNHPSTKHEERTPARFIQHLGGLARSYGSASAWDEWFDSIGKLSTRVPLMVAVGDAEYDHFSGGEDGKDPSGVTSSRGYAPSWGHSVFGSASGGECGVPTARRFTMPSTGNGNFWYSYSYGSVHTIVLSSEHDLSAGSIQHGWLLQELRSVDRSKTPWLIVESHRPLYHSQMQSEELEVAIAMRYELESLFYDFGVDLYLSGHAQTYLRTCEGLYRSKCGIGGTVHISVGTMGAGLNADPLYSNRWTETFIEERGYGRATVHNSTALHWQFIANADGKALDDVWIYKKVD